MVYPFYHQATVIKDVSHPYPHPVSIILSLKTDGTFVNMKKY